MNNLINSIVYGKGITATLKNRLAVLLITDRDEVVGSSACIANEASEENYLREKITWNKENKYIEIGSFAFEETRSGTDLGETTQTATNFLVVKLDVSDESETVSPAYEGAKLSYKWPVFNLTNQPKEENILFRGKLKKPIDIQIKNNFKFDKAYIKLSEAQNI